MRQSGVRLNLKLLRNSHAVLSVCVRSSCSASSRRYSTRARQLHRFHAVTQADSGRLAIGRRTGQRIAQRADLRIGADVPVLSRHELDAGGVRQTGQRPAVLVTLLEVDAGAVGEPRLRRRKPGCPGELAGRRRPARSPAHSSGRGWSARNTGSWCRVLPPTPEVAVGHLPVDLEAFRRTIRAARADAPVVLTAAARRDRVLDEAVGAPRGTRARTSPARPRPCARPAPGSAGRPANGPRADRCARRR